jgi:hypothetical protein
MWGTRICGCFGDGLQGRDGVVFFFLVVGLPEGAEEQLHCAERFGELGDGGQRAEGGVEF